MGFCSGLTPSQNILVRCFVTVFWLVLFAMASYVVWSPLMTPRLKQKKIEVQVPPNPNLNPSQKSKLYPPVGPLLLFTSDECTV